MTEAVFERFPLDGKLYRLIWAGKVAARTPEMATARIKLWLVLIDESDPAALKYARRESGLPSILALDEAAGSVPKLILGSFWRDRTLQYGHRFPDEMRVRDACLLPQTWQFVRSNDSVGAPGVWRVPRDEFCLTGEDTRGGRISFHDAPLIRCFTESRLELLIPCYEIFRRFYALTSELANAMLAGHWKRELQSLIDVDKTAVSAEGTEYEIVPLVDMRDIGCMGMALFMFMQPALTCASAVYPKLENDRRSGISEPWITAKPPWTEGPFTLSFVGQQLQSGAILVLWIYDSQFPNLSLPVVRIEQEMVVNIKSGEASPRPPPLPPSDKIEEGKSATIRPAIDVRPSRGSLHFSLDETWSDLGQIRRKYLAKRHVPVNPVPEGEPRPKRKRRVSTGRRDVRGTVPGGSLSSDSQNAIRDRFRALASCFVEMLEANELKSREDYALVNPVRAATAAYCAMPMQIAGVQRPWAVLTQDEPRARLCWVSELVAPDNVIFYWVEVEAVAGEFFKALALRPRSHGTPLTPETLEKVLKAAVLDAGKWKTEALRSIEEEVLWVAVRHSYASGVLRRSTVLSKIAELRRKG